MSLRLVRHTGMFSCVLMILAGCGMDESDPAAGYSLDADTMELIDQVNASIGDLALLNRAIRAYRDEHGA